MRKVKPTCEIGRQLIRREKELGITRERALVLLGVKSNQTYINWLRGQEIGSEWYPALEKFFEKRRWVILDWLGLLDTEEVELLRKTLAQPSWASGLTVSMSQAA